MGHMFALAFVVVALSEPVTFSCPVQPLKDSIPALSKAMGRNLKVSSDLEWNTIYVKVKNADPQQVLDKLAYASYGKWENQDGVLSLVEDAAFIKSIRAKESAAWRAVLKAELPKSNPKEDDGPTSVVKALLRSIGVEKLATLEEDERRVYSTHPTKMQRPMSITSDQVQILVSAHNDMIQAARSKPQEQMVMPPGMEKFITPETTALLQKMSERERPAPISEPPVKFDLVLRRGSSGMEAQLRGYSGEGKLVVSAGSYVSSQLEDSTPEEEDPAPLPKGKPLQLSKTSTEFLGLVPYYTEWGEREGGVSLDLEKKARLRALIPDPLHTDPFLALQTELLDQGVSSANIVAHVDAWTLRPQSPTTLNTSWLASEIDNLTKVESPDWTVLRPADAYYPVNRTSFNRAMSLSKVSRNSFDERAEFAYLFQYGDLGGQQAELVDALMLDESPAGDTNSDLLCLYWSLGGAARERLKSGQPVLFSALSKESSDMLAETTYGVEPELGPEWDREDPFKSQNAASDINEVIKAAYEEFTRERLEIMSEPTEALPNGLPPDGIIRMKVTDEDAYSTVYGRADEPKVGGLSLDELLMDVAAAEQPPSGFRAYSRRRVSLSVAASADYGARCDVFQVIKEPSEPKAISELNTAAQARLQKMRDNIALGKKFQELFGVGNGRGYTPPPRSR